MIGHVPARKSLKVDTSLPGGSVPGEDPSSLGELGHSGPFPGEDFGFALSVKGRVLSKGTA